MRKTVLFILFVLIPAAGQAINFNRETGLDFYRQKQYREAYTIFFHLEEKTPLAENCFYLGNISYALGRLEEAESWYEKGIALGGLQVEDNLYFNLSVVYLKKDKEISARKTLEKIKEKTPLVRIVLAALHYRAGLFADAESQIQALIKEVQALPVDFLMSAYENYFFSSIKLNKVYQALRIGHMLSNYVDTSEDFKSAYGGLLFSTGQTGKALGIFENLLKSEAKANELNYYKLMLLYIKKKEYKTSASFISDALLKYPESKNIVKIRAYIFYLLEEYENAWAAISALNTVTKEEFKMKAIIAFKAGQPDRAKEILESAFLLHPQEDILINLLSLYIKEENYKKTQLMIQFYHKKTNTDKFALWLFQIAILEQKFESALDIGEQMLRSDAQQPHHFYYNLGKVYEKMGIFQKAMEMYEVAINTDPEFPYPYVALASIQVNYEDYDAGIDNYLIAIKFLPEYGVYYYQLAQAYALSEQHFMAQEAIRQAVYKGFDKGTIYKDPLFSKLWQQFPDLEKLVMP